VPRDVAIDVTNLASRVPRDDRPSVYVMSNDAACPYNGTVSDRHARKHDGAGSDERVRADRDRSDTRPAERSARTRVVGQDGDVYAQARSVADLDEEAEVRVKESAATNEYPMTEI
jgi:hypothetical protein